MMDIHKPLAMHPPDPTAEKEAGRSGYTGTAAKANGLLNVLRCHLDRWTPHFLASSMAKGRKFNLRAI